MKKFKIPGFEPTEPDTKIVAIDAFYDRHTRSWIIQCKNKAGDQIGNAEYVYSKGEKERRVTALKKEYKIK